MKKNLKILSLDLDGTLIKSDMLLETFWSAFSYDLFIPIKSLFLLTKGKSNLKSFLYEKSAIACYMLAVSLTKNVLAS